MTRHLQRWTGKRNAMAYRGLTGLLLLGLVSAAHPAPEVEAGLADFRQARFAEALTDWEQAAHSGDPRGALYAGVLFDSGIGVQRDFRQAMEWYHRAAEGGSAIAAFNIGVMYDGGFGVDANPAQAAAWYERAATAGFARAQYNLAMLYELGEGVPRDRVHAVALYRSAAAQGISAASEHLAALRAPAAAAPRQPPEDAAVQDFASAQRALLSQGATNATRAARLFRRAAEHHNAVAEYDLGYCYEHGLGVTADTAAAARWYHRAASDATDSALRSVAQQSASTVGGDNADKPTN